MQDAIDSVRQLLNTLSRRQHGPILRSPPVGLTSSEAKVLRFVAQGKSNHQIAQELQISEKTVANHLSHIFYKTGSDNRAGAAAFVTKFPSWDRHFSPSMFFAVWAIGLAKSAFFPSHSELLPVIDSSSPFRTRTKMSNFSVALVSALGYTSSVSIQSGTHHSFREKHVRDSYQERIVLVEGAWMYLYWAVSCEGNTLKFLRSRHLRCRNKEAFLIESLPCILQRFFATEP